MAGAPQGGVYQQAAQGMQTAGAGTTALGMAAANAPQLATTNLQPYLNPYTQEVINAQQADVLRGAQMGLNELGRQATQAGAYGGSRHGVAMGELGRGVAQTLAQQSAQLRQAGFGQAQQAALSDIQNRMAGQQTALQAANQLANISNLGFGMGQTLQGQLAQQGAQQQAMQQALIDAAKGQYAGYTTAPASSIQYVTSALGATPVPMSSTQTTSGSSSPGLFDMLTAGASIAPLFMGSDRRLKTEIKMMGRLKNGIGLFRWKWTEKAKELGFGKDRTFGVMADEVAEVYPDAVKIGEDGYMRVNYNHPALMGA
jgi:hypothetical protein